MNTITPTKTKKDMKKLLYTLATVFVSTIVLAQNPTQEENYIYNITPQVPVQTETALNQLSEDHKIEAVTYYDGLGRPKQSISRQAGGDKQDILVPIIYDEFGRQVNEYLPYLRNTSSLEYDSGLVADVDGTILSLNEFYQNKYPNDFAGLSVEQVNPYSEKVFEASPLNRILEQAAPGKDWAVGNGHTIKFDYQANGENEVKYFSVSHPNDDTEQTELVFEGYYQANELYKTITKDENWTLGKAHTTEEFKDKQGRVILKRTYNSSSLKSKHDTYYVYDNFGNLTYVLPPEASKQILTEGAQGYRVTSQTNYPWVDMVNVDKEFAEDYNRQLKAYENEAI